MSAIVIRGARQHNLKNIDLEIPHSRLVVITGLSGSGKSSLAFDTLYAEGQRRYVESLSAYARQFLGQVEKPDVDSVDGLAPAIAIQQAAGAHNPRSTVGTVTEVYDYLRLLFARVGVPHCFRCERTIAPQTVQQVVDRLLALPGGTRADVLAPVVRGRKGEHGREIAALRRAGFVRARVDGKLHDLAGEIPLRRRAAHTIEAVVDRLVIRPGIERRLADSLEVAFRYGDDTVVVDAGGEGELVFSRRFACAACGVSYPELSPRFFSFNSPYGACPACGGLGSKRSVDPALLFPDPDRSLRAGALRIGERRGFAGLRAAVQAVATRYGADLDAPVSALPDAVREVLLHGTGEEVVEFVVERAGRRHVFRRPFEGLVAHLERRYRETTSPWRRAEIEACMRERPCEQCGGSRLRPECRFVRLRGRNIVELSAMPVRELQGFLARLELDPKRQEIARQVLREITERLGFLAEVGVGYLSLDRPSTSLSGGESQRIRLATQIGSRLTGVLYILDEPSIGLHPRDTTRLLAMLRCLRDLGNTVIVVEHDRETILAADEVIDMGPGAGVHGGRVVAQGPPQAIASSPLSLTGRYLSGELEIPVPGARRGGSGWSLVVRGARHNNLRNVTVEIPLGAMTCVTGVSGAGKSSLVIDTIYRALAQRLSGAREPPGAFDDMSGWQLLDKVIEIDQSPIGRTPRSNPATYTGLFGPVRDLLAQRPEARTRGYGPARFSFNVRGGRCEACGGAGVIRIEMQLLPDVHVTCEVCGGRRYDRETLEVRYKGRDIAEILDLTVTEALEFFGAVPPIRQKLETLCDVGLGYLTLGQPATTLSGGEAQRLKLARELARRATGRTLYVLDEPTTGLHFEDIGKLLAVLGRLVDAGNTVVIIEHNLDVIKCADHVIDLGPEGGAEGGDVVVAGPPEEVARHPRSQTGRFLRGLLGFRAA